MRRFLTTVGLLLAAGALMAAEPEPIKFSAVATERVTMSGETPTSVTPGVRLSVDGPVAAKDKEALRVSVRLDVRSMPNETVDLTSVKTYRNADLALGGFRQVGRLPIQGQDIRSYVGAEWGFSTTLDHTPEPLLHYPRHYGAGFKLEERTSGSNISVLYGRHEVGGDRGYGQWMVSGAIPLAFAKKAVVVGGDAILSVGKQPSTVEEKLRWKQRDVMQVWLGVSIPDLVAAFEKK